MAYKINPLGPINPDGLDDIAEAIFNEKEKPPEPENKEEVKRVIASPPVSAVQNLDRHIILEGQDYGDYSYPDLLVAMDKDREKMSWYENHMMLSREKSYMLTMRQFVDLLTLLKSGKAFDGKGNALGKSASEDLFDRIVARANVGPAASERSEWLDAKFSRKGLTKRMYITYHSIKASGILDEITEPVESCLIWSRKPGIDINFWLGNATYQGMPKNNAPDGDVHYLAPRNGKVASFSANMDKIIFSCREDPHLLRYGLSVRHVRLK